MTLTGVTGIGTYTCNSSSGNTMSLTKILPRSGNGIVVLPISWGTTGKGTSGTLNVTDIDPVNKMISGTFSASLSTGQSKIITDGTFSVPYY
jgi:hypothetical protein